MTSVHCRYCKGKLDEERRFNHESTCKHEEIEKGLFELSHQVNRMTADITALALVDVEPDNELCPEVGALTQIAKMVKQMTEHDIIRMHIGIKTVKYLVDVIHESVGERLEQLAHKVVKQ